MKGPKYSVAYANLCKVMSTIKVEYTAEDGRPQIYTFRRVLLTKVQREFEKAKEDDEEREGLLRAIEATQDVSVTARVILRRPAGRLCGLLGLCSIFRNAYRRRGGGTGTPPPSLTINNHVAVIVNSTTIAVAKLSSVAHDIFYSVLCNGVTCTYPVLEVC